MLTGLRALPHPREMGVQPYGQTPVLNVYVARNRCSARGSQSVLTPGLCHFHVTSNSHPNPVQLTLALRAQPRSITPSSTVTTRLRGPTQGSMEAQIILTVVLLSHSVVFLNEGRHQVPGGMSWMVHGRCAQCKRNPRGSIKSMVDGDLLSLSTNFPPQYCFLCAWHTTVCTRAGVASAIASEIMD